jgi:hypothetical protein
VRVRGLAANTYQAQRRLTSITIGQIRNPLTQDARAIRFKVLRSVGNISSARVRVVLRGVIFVCKRKVVLV